MTLNAAPASKANVGKIKEKSSLVLTYIEVNAISDKINTNSNNGEVKPE